MLALSSASVTSLWLWSWHTLETACISALEIAVEQHTRGTTCYKLQSVMRQTTVDMVEVHLEHLSPLCCHTSCVTKQMSSDTRSTIMLSGKVSELEAENASLNSSLQLGVSHPFFSLNQ